MPLKKNWKREVERSVCVCGRNRYFKFFPMLVPTYPIQGKSPPKECSCSKSEHNVDQVLGLKNSLREGKKEIEGMDLTLKDFLLSEEGKNSCT